jgi:parallel beta-helix repeat protein
MSPLLCAVRGLVANVLARPALLLPALVLSMCAVIGAQQSPHGGANVKPQPGPNVNAAAGVVNPNDPAAVVKSDLLLQRQNETVVASSTRNGDHILAAANDYRFVDFPNDAFFGDESGIGNVFARLIAKIFRRSEFRGVPGRAAAAAGGWTGVYRSCDRGATWLGSALPGSPLDNSPASLRSPIKALSNSAPVGAHAETTDPVMVAGPRGRIHLVVLGFLRFDDGRVSNSTMYYSSYTDRNNLEGGSCFNYDFTTEIDRGTAYATPQFPSPFIDKPSIAIDKDGMLYVAYTVFTDEDHSKVVIARSSDNGATWQKTMPILSLGFLRNHGTTIAIDQLNGVVYVAWRLFFQNWPLMVISKSIDRGKTFFPATPVSDFWPAMGFDQIIAQLKAAKLQPFDQFTSIPGDPATARALAFPHIASVVVNGKTKIFAVWQERADINPFSPTFGLPLAGGSPRIMLTMSSDGGWSWTPRRAIDAGPRTEPALQPGSGPEVTRPSTPQLQPVLSVSGTTNPQLLLFYYEARAELEAPFLTNFVSGIDRELDARAARINPATGTLLSPSRQVSQYNIQAESHDPVVPAATAPSHSNLTMYGGGKLAFFGDYPTLAPSTPFEFTTTTWQWTAEPNSSLAIWTDNRDVQFPGGTTSGDWTKYTPVKDLTGKSPLDCNFVAMRNANPYFAEVAGVVAGSPQTFKRLTIQRAFVTYVANRTSEDRFFRLTLVPQAGIQASFDQFGSQLTDTVQIFSNSSHTRSVWVQANPTNPTGSVRLVVEEIDAGGQLVAGGYRTTLKLNADPNNDALTPIPPQVTVPPGTDPSINVTELHNPQVSAPQISAFRIPTPQVSAPQVSAPQVSAPQVSAPQVSAPQVSAPQVSAPQVSAPQISAVDPNGTDVTYTVTNGGNTDSAYNAFLNVANVNALVNSGSYNFQLLIVRPSLAPGFVQTANGCTPAAETKVQVIANLQVPQVSAPQISAIQNPQISATQPADAVASFFVAPAAGADVASTSDDSVSTVLRDEVKIVLRAIRLRPLADIAADGLPVFNPNDVVVRVAATSTNVLNGVVQGTSPADAPSTLGANTAIVTNTNDAGTGSLRQAILNANLNPENNQILFNIVGPTTVTLSTPLPTITGPISLDATTQPGFQGAPIVQLTGIGAGAGGNGFRISAGNSTIRGFIISGFTGDGIRIDTKGGNFIEGNIVTGNTGNGIEILGTAGNRIGGTTSLTRNLISGNHGEGIRVDGPTATSNLIAGNYIGTNAAGSAAFGNSNSGVYLRRAGHNSVLDNVVSGNLGFAGIAICGNAAFCGGGVDTGAPADAAGNIVRGNIIGFAANGVAPLGNTGFGVSIDGTTGTLVGGTGAGEGNRIANNSRGVIVFNPGAIGNVIRGNSIDANLGLGIDLGNNGVTQNDLKDADTGPNNFQNFPFIASAVSGGGTTTVSGRVDSKAATQIVVDFYSSPRCDPSGNGEGATWLGAMTTNTGTGTVATVNAQLPVLPNGTVITATATTTDGTSEFSGCRLVLPPNLTEWSVAEGGNGHVYEYVRTPGTWTAAKTAATARSLFGVAGHLVTITSAAENAIVTGLKGNGDLRAWIGLSDAAYEGVYVWVTGEPFNFSNWALGEPNGLPNEDFVEIFASGKWNDIDNNATFGGVSVNQGFIVEYDINPTGAMGPP